MNRPSTTHNTEQTTNDNMNVVNRARTSPYPLFSVDQAHEIINGECRKPTPIRIPKDALYSMGYILAEDVNATAPHPPFRASIMDGYAVRSSDGCGPRRVIASALADTQHPNRHQVTIQPGECVRITTGAPVPDSADAVVKVEDTELIQADETEELTIDIKCAPKSGQDIRPIGCDIQTGECVVQKGTRISSPEIGIFAMIGCEQVMVYRKPIVAVLSTGNELVPSSTQTLQFGQIRDSNRPQLLLLFRSHGFETVDCGCVKDDWQCLSTALRDALHKCDVLVTSGGVSMGEKDLLKDILTTDLKFTVHFGRVLMKPGKPTTFASGYIQGCERLKYVFALPGNPVSCWVCAHVFVMPALRQLAGADCVHWPIVKAKASCDMKLDPRPEYHRATYISADGETSVAVAQSTGVNQMSSRLTSTKSANLLIKLPARTEEKQMVHKGELVDCLMIALPV